MTEPGIEQKTQFAKALVTAASEKKLTLRVLGGTAVYIACPSLETHPSLQRSVNDVDLVAPRSQFDALASLFADRGCKPISQTRQEWKFESGGIELELTPPDFTEDHRIDLASRLSLASPTLPISDLLLIKLQRVKFAEKDIQDSIALLLDHRVAAGDDQQQIDQLYMAKLCARDWGLFTTVYDNTVTLEKVMDKYVEPEEGQLAWRRIELIQGEMDRQPKSLGWMINQIIRRPAQVAS